MPIMQSLEIILNDNSGYISIESLDDKLHTNVTDKHVILESI
jgi:hypothetical protein